MNDVEYRKNVEIKSISSVKIGALADVVAFPNSEEKLIQIVRFFENVNYPYLIVGRMSNILPSDTHFRGILIKTDRLSNISVNNNRITASCGVFLPSLAISAEKMGLSGFEELSGIPGSVSGAVIGNAGAFGREIGDLVDYVCIYDFESDSVLRFSGSESMFEYRSSCYKKKKCVVLSMGFLLTEGSIDKIKENRQGFTQRRIMTQPIGIPSLGSTFRRPAENISAAKLIDICGLRGICFGDAQISEKHAGFIVNKGDAISKDYLALSEFAKKCVHHKFGIDLEYEIEIM